MQLQKQQYESLSNQHKLTTEPPATESSLASSGEGTAPSNLSESAAYRRPGVDPPGILSSDLRSIPKKEANRPLPRTETRSKPDPPAMEVLIGDALQKLDPTGKAQTNDLEGWVQERLTAPKFARPTLASREIQRADSSSDLDDRKLPANDASGDPFSTQSSQPTIPVPNLPTRLFEIASGAGPTDPIPNFDAWWQRAERQVRSIRDESDTTTTSNPTGRDPDSTRIISQPQSRNSATENVSQLGAIRVSPPQPKDDSDDKSMEDAVDSIHDSDHDSEEVVTAHVVVDDNRDLELQKLNEAVASLQKRQTVLEATAVQVEPVNVVNDNNDDDGDDDGPSFLEVHGTALMMSCFALGLGLVIGLRTRRSHSNA